MTSSEFLLALASSLAYDVIKAGASYLKAKAFGTDEQRAMRSVYRDAFASMLREVLSDSATDEQQEHIGDLLRDFVQQSENAVQLLDLALSRETPPLESLRSHFEAIGFDAETIPFDELMRALISGLDTAAADEARSADSPLINRLIVGRFDAVLSRLEQLLTSSTAKDISPKPSVFISYARADDEPFVERLYHDLKDSFDVWWDRVSMPNRGLTFLQEIRAAIDRHDRLLLVAGPGAFASDYVRDEWQHAYESFKGINIALRLGEYAQFPAQLRGFDAPDFRSDAHYAERLAALKRQLAQPVAPFGALRDVPALPPHFMSRPEALDVLRSLVISDVDRPTLISAEKRTTAIEGLGGIGKSVLAAAFAHDRKVRFAFPNGIVWLTVGHTPSMYELYRAVGSALGDDLSQYADEITARQSAQKTLADKKCLLILDDVWELAVGRAFRDLISGTAARLLITTRNLQINDLLNANEYRLNLIDPAQAAEYLRSWVGDDPDLEAVAGKLGNLFLALKLAGALMKENNLSGTEYLSMFERISDMEIADDSLEVSINLGVDTAFAHHDDRRLLYHTFGIFQEDVPVPQQTVLQLWSYLRPDVRSIDLLKTLTTLVNLGLVERDEHKIITLHDLLHSYTREKLGDRYHQTHRDLLASYEIEAWHELSPDEPYLWWHFGYHFAGSQRLDQLRHLLFDFAFLQSKLRATNVNTLASTYGYFSDSAAALVQNALEMSAYILTGEPDHLASQLYARLLKHSRDHTEIGQLLEQVDQLNEPCLLPRYPTVQAAGNHLTRSLNIKGTPVRQIATSPALVVIAYRDHRIEVRDWRLHTPMWTHAYGDEEVQHIEVRDRTILVITDSGLDSISLDATPRVSRLAGRFLKHVYQDYVLAVSSDDSLEVWDWRARRIVHNTDINAAAASQTHFHGDVIGLQTDKHVLEVWNWRLNQRVSYLELRDTPIETLGITDTFTFYSTDKKTVMVVRHGTHDLASTAEALVMPAKVLRDAGYQARLRKFTCTDKHVLMIIGDVFAVFDIHDLQLVHSHYWHYQHFEMVAYSDYYIALSLSEGFAPADELRILHLADLHWQTIPWKRERVSAVFLADSDMITVSGDGMLDVWHLDNPDAALEEGNASEGKHTTQTVANLLNYSNCTFGAGKLVDSRLYTYYTVSDPEDYHQTYLDIFDLDADQRVHELVEGTTHKAFAAAMDVRGNQIVTVTNRGSVSVYEELELKKTFRVGFYPQTIATNGALLAVGYRNKDNRNIEIWDLAAGTRLQSLAGHTGDVWKVEWAGDHLISVSSDATVRVWNLQISENRSLNGHEGEIFAFAIHDDLLVSGSADGTLRCWDWRQGTLIRTIEGHAGQILDIGLIGEMMVSISTDRRLEIRTQQGRLLASFMTDSVCTYLQSNQHYVCAYDKAGQIHVFRANTGLARLIAQ